MTLEEAKNNLLKVINTPAGKMKLYGINLLPDSNVIGLIFYKNNKQMMFFSVDCSIA